MNNIKNSDYSTKENTKGNDVVDNREDKSYSPPKIETNHSKAYKRSLSYSKKVKVRIEEQD